MLGSQSNSRSRRPIRSITRLEPESNRAGSRAGLPDFVSRGGEVDMCGAGRLRPTVHIVDDDAAVSQALRVLLGSMRMKTRAFSGLRKFLDAYDARIPGCLLLDIRLPELGGMEFLDQIADFGVTLPVIVLTGHGDVPLAVRAMKAGAVDFLRKPAPPQELLDAVQRALRTDAANRGVRADAEERARRLGALTAREREVAALVARGMSSKNVATKLAISARTVESHRASAMNKLGARNLPGLVRLMESMGK